MSVFHAQCFFNSFARATQEAGAQQPRSLHAPLALRKARRLARRVRSLSPAACSSSSSSMDVEMPDISLPPSPTALKRIRLSPPLPHDAECPTATLWLAPAMIEFEKECIRSFYKANTTTICLSVVVANDFVTRQKVHDIACQVGSLGVVGAPSPTPSASRKRCLERSLRDK